MTEPLPPRLADLPLEELAFTPVPMKPRRGGWTADRQRAFILRLAAGSGVSSAARAVGKSRQSAYALRGRPGAGSFAAAWDRALDFARSRPLPPGSTCYERGVVGVIVPLVHRGRVIGYRRKYDSRALGHLLSNVYRLRDRGR